MNGYLKIAECAGMYCHPMLFSCIASMVVTYRLTHKVISLTFTIV